MMIILNIYPRINRNIQIRVIMWFFKRPWFLILLKLTLHWLVQRWWNFLFLRNRLSWKQFLYRLSCLIFILIILFCQNGGLCIIRIVKPRVLLLIFTFKRIHGINANPRLLLPIGSRFLVDNWLWFGERVGFIRCILFWRCLDIRFWLN